MSYSDQGRRGSYDGSRRSSYSNSRRSGANPVKLQGGSMRGRGSGRSSGRSRGGSPVGQRIGRSHDGYSVKSRNINFQNGASGRIFGIEKRTLILGALAVVLVVLVMLLVSSCVSSCSSNDSSSTEDVNQVDSRVAAGVSEDVTREFQAGLDRAEKLQWIAANATRYSDQGLIDLALSTPEAVEFVAAYPDADKSASDYGDYSGSSAPELYCWDSRWGNVDYAGHALALSGSGPTTLAMAYIGLTGTADQTPATIAVAATEAGATSTDSYMSADFLATECETLGLSCESYVSNGDNLSQVLDTGTYLLIEAKAGTLTDDAHWLLLVTENSDGSVVVYDPTSPSVTAHPWDPATLAASCDNLYAVTKAADTTDAAATE